MASASAADDVHGAGGKKIAADSGGGGVVRAPEQGLNCPRCDSSNTKFCYYNNYSLAQPRYFCKACRRYWTKGGALRNVPVGGGCRKSKKSKPSSSHGAQAAISRLSSDAPDLRLYTQLGLPPSVDFHLGGGAGLLPFSRPHRPPSSVVPVTFAAPAEDCSSFGSLSGAGATAAGPGLIGLGYSYPVQAAVGCPNFTEGGVDGGGDSTAALPTTASMAASIESLSSINQSLHWKLQQQRLAMFFGGDHSQHHHHHHGKMDAYSSAALLEVSDRPTSCPVTASSRQICAAPVAAAPLGCGAPRKASSAAGDANSGTAEWFLDTGATTPYANAGTGSNWNGGQTWSDMHQFSALP